MSNITAILNDHYLPIDTLSLVFTEHQAPIYALTLPQSQTVPLWQQFLANSASIGYWPLLLGNPEQLEYFRSCRRYQTQSWQDILQEAQTIDPTALLLDNENVERRKLRTAFRDFRLNRTRPDLLRYPTDMELEQYLEDYYVVLAHELGEDPDEYLPPNPWLSSTIPHITDIPAAVSEGPNCLLLIPTTHSWQVPAYLYIHDGSGSCSHLVRMLHYWQEHYQVELIAAYHSGIEVWLANQLSNPEQARRFAWEMAMIAPEPMRIYDIEKHAAQIMQGQRFWSLWWD